MDEKVNDEKSPLVFITSLLKKFLKWIISLLALLLVWVVSLVICLGIIITFGEAWDLAHNSLSARGSVVSIDHCQLSSDSNNRYQQYGWRLYVRFEDVNGNIHQGEGYGTVCHHPYESMSLVVTVHYLAQNPDFFTTEDADSPLISSFLYGIICSVWMLALASVITPVWLWVTFSPGPKRSENKVAVLPNERPTKIGNFSDPYKYTQVLVYRLDNESWWLSSLDEEGKFTWSNVGNSVDEFGNLQGRQLVWIENFSDASGYAQVLVYVPDNGNWWLSSFTEEGQLIWQMIGNTTGFGNLGDGRPIWVGKFSDGNGYSQILFYSPSDKNWWLRFLTEEGAFTWYLVGNTTGFGNLGDGRPIWVGNFSDGNGCSQILFYSPGDKNWWLSSLTEEGTFSWYLVGNTSGFGNLGDGRPIWVGNFSDGNGRSQILFYSLGDKNWWLSSLTEEGTFTWSYVGNTSGFGNLGDGRPIWVGNFSDGNGRSQILFYSPSDKNWWLSSLTEEGTFSWSHVGNTSGFGNLGDGRPIWVGDFSDGNGYSQILFYSPSDKNWWLSSLTEGGTFTWSHVANF